MSDFSENPKIAKISDLKLKFVYVLCKVPYNVLF